MGCLRLRRLRCQAGCGLKTAAASTTLTCCFTHIDGWCNQLLRIAAGQEEPAKKGADKRVVIVGSITGNTNTLAGNVPPKVGS